MSNPRFAKVAAALLAGSALAAPVATAATTPATANEQDTAVLIVSSSHSFDPRLPELKFTASDGQRVASILASVGRVPKERIVVIDGARLEDLGGAVTRINGILDKCPGCASKFVFYYSGHADEHGLHLKDGLFNKEELHGILGRIHAKAKIVMLDSCFAGAMAQKGVAAAPAFELPKAEFDEPSGSIFISASSGREFSYESDDLRGSVFTYHLVTGMSGEADTSGDGVVTIDELYQYVYRETKLHGLLFPSATSQTPEFVSRLEGRGAIAISYPAATNAHLLLGSDVGGQVTLSARDGIQMFKVDKPLGMKKNVQVPAGRYMVTVSQGYRTGQTELTLTPQRFAQLGGAGLTWSDGQYGKQTAKGPAAAAEAPVSLGVALGAKGAYVGNQSKGTEARLRAGIPMAGSFSMFGEAAIDQHEGREGRDDSTMRVARLGIGTAFAWRNPYTPSMPQDLELTGTFSAARIAQDWRYAAAVAPADSRSFVSVAPAAAFGASYGLRWPALPVRVSLEAERAFLFVKDARTGRRNLGADFFGIGIRY